MSDDVLVSRALARLRDPGSPLLAEGIALVVEAALERPLREVVDAQRAIDLVVAAIDDEKVERALTTVARPAMDRQRAALAAKGETLGAYLPEGASVLLDDIAAGTRPPRGEWAQKLVDPAHVRELLSPVLQDTLLAFARKLPMVGGGGGATESGGASKLLGGLARGLAQGAGERAAKIADLGRGVLGGLGAEMEKRIGTAAKDFSQSAFEPLRGAFEERLASEEGRAILTKMRRRAIDVLLDAKVSELLDDLDAAPRAPLDRLIARTVAHDVARPEVQALLRAEVEAFLAAREGWTVRQLLDEWGVTAQAVDEAKRFGETVARAAVQQDAFGAWLRALIAE
ncbi:hypothetical protein [Sandaracinus amylolyticus]|uniref:hypothetical protein n=1 Tax=Sandaracinus amylolyticus TaxID=927083 RepID=UPI001F45784F|nr:hypothetical protein [Sandaracinus amylolyticus]UJR83330.1 Hypothetical protein I5071_53980 [Sandaracinus amylolyticus]